MPKWAKTGAKVFGGLLGVLLVAIIVLPFVINVDSYRPEIIKIANENINGKLDLGKLTLSLWGQIRIQVDGFTIADKKGQSVVSAKDVFFHVPFAPLLSGNPVLTFKMKSPEIRVLKDKAGKLNVMSLMKPSSVKTKDEPSTPSTEKTKLPAMASRAALGVEMTQAQFSYRDEATKLVSEIKDLNLRIRSISLTKPSDFEIWASLDTRMGKTLAVQGPAKITGTLVPTFEGVDFKSGTLNVKADLDGVGISMPGLFEKKAGLATNLLLEVTVSPTAANLKSLKAVFFNVVVNGSGAVTQIDSTPVFDLKLVAAQFELKPWSDLLPMLKEYELGGAAGFSADLGGTANSPQYKASVDFKNFTAKAPNLKTQPHFDGSIRVVTDKLENATITMKAPGNDLKIVASVLSFAAPKIAVNVTSVGGLDLDQLIEFPKTAAAKEAAPAAGNSGSGTGTGADANANASDFDALLDPLRQNELMAKATLNARASLPFVTAKGVKMSAMNALMTLNNLNLALDSFAMNVFDGKLFTSMAVALKPKTPTYRLKLEVTGLDMQKAVASQLSLFKNTVIGKANFKMEGTGASFNPDPAKKNLKVAGNMRIENATFTSIDIGRMASDGINKAIGDLSKTVPGLGGKTVPQLKTDTAYESVGSDFTIAGGKFSAPNFSAKSRANKGIDFNGATEVGLLDYSLRANWEMVDTYNLTKARDLSVESNGIQVNPLLADGANPVRFPIKVGGTCFAPEINYGAVPEALAKVALNNVSKALAAKAKAEVQKQVQQEIQKVAPGVSKEVNQAIKGLFGN